MVGCPGRLLDLFEQGALPLGQVETLVRNAADCLVQSKARHRLDARWAALYAVTHAERCALRNAGMH